MLSTVTGPSEASPLVPRCPRSPESYRNIRLGSRSWNSLWAHGAGLRFVLVVSEPFSSRRCLAALQNVLIVDEATDKKSSAGVADAARQYSGTVGGIAYCQMAVTVNYATGTAPVPYTEFRTPPS